MCGDVLNEYDTFDDAVDALRDCYEHDDREMFHTWYEIQAAEVKRPSSRRRLCALIGGIADRLAAQRRRA